MADIPIGATEADAVPTFRGSELDSADANIAPDKEWKAHVGWGYRKQRKVTRNCSLFAALMAHSPQKVESKRRKL